MWKQRRCVPWPYCLAQLCQLDPISLLYPSFFSVCLYFSTPQSEQHDAVKAQLQQAQLRATNLEADLASLQAQHHAACNAQTELVQEKGQLEKRVSL